FSALWIVVTDWGLDWSHLTGAPAFAASAAKGLIFVFASGALIYWLVDRDSRRVARANALFKLVADGTTDAVFVKDRAGKYLLFNPAASQFVGKSVVEVLGKDDRELFDPASAAEVMGHDQRVMTRGEPDTEAETLTAVGVTRTYLVTKAPFRDDTGRVVGLIGIGRDVTRLREVERAAHESDERLRFALEGARGGAWYWDLDTGETWWSKELYDLWGVPNGRRMDYGSAIAIVEPADHDSIRAAVERAVATKTPYHAEFRIRHPVLGERWMTSHGRIVGADEGRKGRLLGISLDVTDRKRAEVALQGEQQRLFQLAQSAPGVICSFRLDPNGKTSFPYASPGIIDIYGIRAEDLSVDASGIFELIHPDDAAAFQASIDESRSRMTPWHQTYRVVQASGRERWIEGRAAPSREPDGGMLWHGYLMDVTDRKRDEAALSAQHALLRSQLEASPDGILLVSQEGRILSYNQRLLEIWGISEEIAEAGDDGPMLKLATQRTSHPEAFEARVHEIYSKPELRSHDEVAFA
ncbi:MAG TPA: PAS domain S-box protein, partial [Pirellulales bacterium]